jgi:type I restriction-modification system DNA methylase subunit
MKRIELLKKSIKNNTYKDIILKKTDVDLVYDLYTIFLDKRDYSSAKNVISLFENNNFFDEFHRAYSLSDDENSVWDEFSTRFDKISMAHIHKIIAECDIDSFIDALLIWDNSFHFNGMLIDRQIYFSSLDLLPDILHKDGKDKWILVFLEKSYNEYKAHQIVKDVLFDSNSIIINKALRLLIKKNKDNEYNDDVSYSYTTSLTNIILEVGNEKILIELLYSIKDVRVVSDDVLNMICKHDKKLFSRILKKISNNKNSVGNILIMALRICLRFHIVENNQYLATEVENYINRTYTKNVLEEIKEIDSIDKDHEDIIRISNFDYYLTEAYPILFLTSCNSPYSFNLIEFSRKYDFEISNFLDSVMNYLNTHLKSNRVNLYNSLGTHIFKLMNSNNAVFTKEDKLHISKVFITNSFDNFLKINDNIFPFYDLISKYIINRIDKTLTLDEVEDMIDNGTSLHNPYQSVFIQGINEKDALSYIQVSFWISIKLLFHQVRTEYRNFDHFFAENLNIYNININHFLKLYNLAEFKFNTDNNTNPIPYIVILKKQIDILNRINDKEDSINEIISDVLMSMINYFQNKTEFNEHENELNMIVNNSKLSAYLDELNAYPKGKKNLFTKKNVNSDIEIYIKSTKLLNSLNDTNSNELSDRAKIKVLDTLIIKYPKLYFLFLVRSHYNRYENNEEQSKDDFKTYFKHIYKYDPSLQFDHVPKNRLGILLSEYMKQLTSEELEIYRSIIVEICRSSVKIHNIWFTLLIKLNMHKEAIAYISQLIEGKPDFLMFYEARFRTYFYTKQYKKVAEDLSRMIGMNPEIIELDDDELSQILDILVKKVPSLLLPIFNGLIKSEQEIEFMHPIYYWRSKTHFELKNYFHALFDSNMAITYCESFTDEAEFLLDWNLQLLDDKYIQLQENKILKLDSTQDSMDVTEFLLSVQEWELKSRGILNTVKNLLNSNSVEPLILLMKEKNITKLTGPGSWFIDNNYNFVNNKSKEIKLGSLIKDDVSRKGVVFDLQNSTLNPYFKKETEFETTIKKTPTELLEDFNNIINIVRSDSTNIDLVKYVFILIFLKRISDMSNRDSHLGNSFWSILRNRAAHASNDGSLLTNLIDKYLNVFAFNSPLLEQVFQNISFSECSIVNSLSSVILYLSKIDLSERSVSISSMGFAFNKIIETVFKKDKLSDSVITSETLRYLMVSLLEPEVNNSYYDPFIGIGGFQNKLAGYFKYNSIKISKCKIVGQEINEAVYSICLMNLFVNGHFNTNIFLGNTLDKPSNFINNNFETYDYVISHPPFGVVSNDFSIINTQKNRFKIGLPRSKKMDYVILHHIISSMNDRGKAVILIPRTVLYAEDQMRKLRKYLMDKDWIESIISIPIRTNSLTLNFILILNKNKVKVRKNKVQFINGENVQSSELVDFNFESDPIGDITSAYFSEDEFSTATISTLINNDKIVQNNYNLDYRNYKSILFEIENKLKTGEYKRIKEIIELIKPIPVPKNKTVSQQSIRISDLNKLVGEKYFTSKNFKISNYRNSVTDVEDNSILVALKGDHLKPTIYKKRSYPVSISNNVLAIRPKKSVDLDYLYYQLYSTLTLTQLDAYRKGLTIPYITKREFLNIAISIPPLHIQKELVLQQRSTILEDEKYFADKEIRNSLSEKKSIEQSRTMIDTLAHNMLPIISNEHTDLLIIEEYLKNKSLINDTYSLSVPEFEYDEDQLEALTEDDLLFDVETLSDIIFRMKDDLTRLSTTIENAKKIILLIDIEEDFDEFDLKDLLINIKSKCVHKNFKIIINCVSTIIKANKEAITQMFDNLLSNANMHAFKDYKKNNQVEFDVKKFSSRNEIQISYKNNGEKFPFTKEEFIKLGLKRSNSKGSGIGGKYIDGVIKAHNGFFDIIKSKNGTHFIIILPIK